MPWKEGYSYQWKRTMHCLRNLKCNGLRLAVFLVNFSFKFQVLRCCTNHWKKGNRAMETNLLARLELHAYYRKRLISLNDFGWTKKNWQIDLISYKTQKAGLWTFPQSRNICFSFFCPLQTKKTLSNPEKNKATKKEPPKKRNMKKHLKKQNPKEKQKKTPHHRRLLQIPSPATAVASCPTSPHCRTWLCSATARRRRRRRRRKRRCQGVAMKLMSMLGGCFVLKIALKKNILYGIAVVE